MFRYKSTGYEMVPDGLVIQWCTRRNPRRIEPRMRVAVERNNPGDETQEDEDDAALNEVKRSLEVRKS